MSPFEKYFKQPPFCTTSAPGRLEILGNHTDYNQGFVLSCTVEQRTSVSLAPSGPDNICRLFSEAFPDDECKFTVSERLNNSNSKSFCKYAQGVVAGMLRRNIDVPPFNAYVTSELPISAGMSSSAAFEIALILGLLHLSKTSLTPLEISRIGQESESQAVGANTGLMDQLSICLGREEHLIRTEYRGCSGYTLGLPPEFAFVVIDSAETHDLSSEYNDRRVHCEQATAILASLEPNVTSLRDVTSTMLNRHSDALGEHLLFSRHIVEENQRVLEAEPLVANRDMEGFGQLLFDSHESSRTQFKNSSESLDRIIEMAHSDSRCLGARLSGGGFGGVTIHLVHRKDAENYARELANRAKEKDGKKHWYTVVTIGSGPSMVKH